MSTQTTTHPTDARTDVAVDTEAKAGVVGKLMGFFLAVAIIGWGASTFLTAVHFWALPLPEGIEPQGSMAVITSSWAYIGPIPLALVGALYYVVMIALGATWRSIRHPLLDKVMLPMTGLGVLMSAGLVYLQLGPIGEICPFCMVSATATTLLFLTELGVKSQGGSPAARPINPSIVWGAAFVGTAVMVLVAMFGITLAPIPGA